MSKTFKLTNERAKELRANAQEVLDQSAGWVVAAQDLLEFFDSVVESTEEPERVIFRKFPHNGEVIALFPDQYSERTGNIGSYLHNGQHADTVPDFGDTKAADYSDYADLYRELVGQGYTNLRIVKRFGKLGR